MNKLQYAGLLLAVLLLGAFAYNYYSIKTAVMPCEATNTGSLTITNKTRQPVKVYVDGNYKGLANTNESVYVFSLSASVHTVKTVQAEGCLLSPDVTSSSVDIIRCKDKTIEVIR